MFRVALLVGLLLCTAAGATPESDIVAAVDRELPRSIKLLERAVRISSATGNRAGIRRVGELFGRELRPLGFRVSWQGGHLVAERAERVSKRGRRLLLIGHLDTVVASGAWRRDGDRAFGSGTADCKGGDVVIVAALRALAAARVLDGAGVIVVLTGDEERPVRPTDESRAPLVAAAGRSDAALAFEVGIGTTATVARRGTTEWRLEVTSPTGHSSGVFGAGVGSGAVFAAARILSRWRDQVPEPLVTLNPGLLVGGTEADLPVGTTRGTASGKTNVVAARALATGDLRFVSLGQREAAKERMRTAVTEALPQAHAVLTFEDGYPPMPASDGNRELLGVLDEVSRDLGLGGITALDPGARGAGDASFVGPVVAVLDGLGVKGGETHTTGEWVDLATLPDQIRRAAVLMYRLTR